MREEEGRLPLPDNDNYTQLIKLGQIQFNQIALYGRVGDAKLNQLENSTVTHICINRVENQWKAQWNEILTKDPLNLWATIVILSSCQADLTLTCLYMYTNRQSWTKSLYTKLKKKTCETDLFKLFCIVGSFSLF